MCFYGSQLIVLHKMQLLIKLFLSNVITEVIDKVIKVNLALFRFK